jgi:hypothetical protein
MPSPRRPARTCPGSGGLSRGDRERTGGITGPLLFSALVSTGKVSGTVLAFSIGATLVILAGLAEIFLGVRAERQSLEDIAQPLTAQDAGPTPAISREVRQ